MEKNGFKIMFSLIVFITSFFAFQGDVKAYTDYGSKDVLVVVGQTTNESVSFFANAGLSGYNCNSWDESIATASTTFSGAAITGIKVGKTKVVCSEPSSQSRTGGFYTFNVTVSDTGKNTKEKNVSFDYKDNIVYGTTRVTPSYDYDGNSNQGWSCRSSDTNTVVSAYGVGGTAWTISPNWSSFPNHLNSVNSTVICSKTGTFGTVYSMKYNFTYTGWPKKAVESDPVKKTTVHYLYMIKGTSYVVKDVRLYNNRCTNGAITLNNLGNNQFGVKANSLVNANNCIVVFDKLSGGEYLEYHISVKEQTTDTIYVSVEDYGSTTKVYSGFNIKAVNSFDCGGYYSLQNSNNTLIVKNLKKVSELKSCTATIDRESTSAGTVHYSYRNTIKIEKADYNSTERGFSMSVGDVVDVQTGYELNATPSVNNCTKNVSFTTKTISGKTTATFTALKSGSCSMIFGIKDSTAKFTFKINVLGDGDVIPQSGTNTGSPEEDLVGTLREDGLCDTFAVRVHPTYAPNGHAPNVTYKVNTSDHKLYLYQATDQCTNSKYTALCYDPRKNGVGAYDFAYKPIAYVDPFDDVDAFLSADGSAKSSKLIEAFGLAMVQKYHDTIVEPYNASTNPNGGARGKIAAQIAIRTYIFGNLQGGGSGSEYGKELHYRKLFCFWANANCEQLEWKDGKIDYIPSNEGTADATQILALAKEMWQWSSDAAHEFERNGFKETDKVQEVGYQFVMDENSAVCNAITGTSSRIYTITGKLSGLSKYNNGELKMGKVRCPTGYRCRVLINGGAYSENDSLPVNQGNLDVSFEIRGDLCNKKLETETEIGITLKSYSKKDWHKILTLAPKKEDRQRMFIIFSGNGEPVENNVDLINPKEVKTKCGCGNCPDSDFGFSTANFNETKFVNSTCCLDPKTPAQVAYKQAHGCTPIPCSDGRYDPSNLGTFKENEFRDSTCCSNPQTDAQKEYKTKYGCDGDTNPCLDLVWSAYCPNNSSRVSYHIIEGINKRSNKEDIDTCIIGKKDAAGNNYLVNTVKATDAAGTSTEMCKTYCFEGWNFDLPANIGDVYAGTGFKIGINSVSGSRTCVNDVIVSTTFTSKVQEFNRLIVNYYNELQKAKALGSAYSSATKSDVKLYKSVSCDSSKYDTYYYTYTCFTTKNTGTRRRPVYEVDDTSGNNCTGPGNAAPSNTSDCSTITTFTSTTSCYRATRHTCTNCGGGTDTINEEKKDANGNALYHSFKLKKVSQTYCTIGDDGAISCSTKSLIGSTGTSYGGADATHTDRGKSGGDHWDNRSWHDGIDDLMNAWYPTTTYSFLTSRTFSAIESYYSTKLSDTIKARDTFISSYESCYVNNYNPTDSSSSNYFYKAKVAYAVADYNTMTMIGNDNYLKRDFTVNSSTTEYCSDVSSSPVCKTSATTATIYVPSLNAAGGLNISGVNKTVNVDKYYKVKNTANANFKLPGEFYLSHIDGSPTYVTMGATNQITSTTKYVGKFWSEYYDKNGYPYPEDKVIPISTTLPAAKYEYGFKFVNIGRFGNTSNFGRLIGGTDGDGSGSILEVYGKNNNSIDKTGKTVCYFDVKEQMCHCCGKDPKINVISDCTNGFGKCQPKPGDYMDPNAVPGMYTRTVSLNDLNPNGRTLGDNWNVNSKYSHVAAIARKTIENIEKQGNAVYETPEYSFTINAAGLALINSTTNNFSENNLYCNDDGINCSSTYLDQLANQTNPGITVNARLAQDKRFTNYVAKRSFYENGQWVEKDISYSWK